MNILNKLKGFIKRYKGTPAFKFIILLLIIFIINAVIWVGNVFQKINEEPEPPKTIGEVIERFFDSVDETTPEKDEQQPIKIKIGWGNIIAMTGLLIALGIVKRRQNIGRSGEQHTSMYHRDDTHGVNDDDDVYDDYEEDNE